MSALDLKMFRNLRRLWAQVLAIALVLGCGIMIQVGATATQKTLVETQAAWYERHRFADIFANATRAPDLLLADAAQIPGVAAVEGRVTFSAILDIDGMEEPAGVRVLSLAEEGARLNLPLLRRGRLPQPDHADEVLLNEPFAEANSLVPGSRFGAILNGQLRQLQVTGWVLSPEFVYTIAPGQMMPDDRHFGLVWMNHRAAAAVMDMDGAFNDLSLRLARGADARAVITAVDALLAPYGGTGAYGRDRQVSHAFISGEMQQLGVMATYMPPIFLLVAAFLVNMVLGQLIALERAQIGLLKALGYRRRDIGAHYLKLALLVGVLGIALGWGFGWWIADAMIGLYGDFFRFPFILRDYGSNALVVSALLAAATVTLGALRAVWASLKLPPAEAMRPPAPPSFARGFADRMIEAAHLRQTSVMVIRSIIRWPGRAFGTILGVAASVGVLVMSYFMFDSVDLLTGSIFGTANRQDISLALAGPRNERAVQDAAHLPGVQWAEGEYLMPVRLIHGRAERLSVLRGHFAGAELARLVDDRGAVVSLPREGVVLPRLLANALQVSVGAPLRIEMLAAPRGVLTLPVTAIIDQGMGQEAHIAAPALFAAMQTAPQVTTLHIAVDENHRAALNQAVKSTPAIAGLTDWAEVRRQFDATLAENLVISVTIYTAIGLLIAIGVIYNAARIQLARRSHELATLRVLGFSRLEVAYVLVGEMMVLTLLALPLGWVMGYGLSVGLVGAMSTDLIQLPFQITRRTYALASIAVFVASLAAVLLVRRRLDHVNLVTALKARE